MTQTVIGIFDNAETAQAAEETLINQGIDESSLRLATKDGVEYRSSETIQTLESIRGFLSDLFGSENADEAELYAQEIEQGWALLAAEVPDDVEIQPIQQAMLDAGAIDMEERLAELFESQDKQKSSPQQASQSMPIIEEHIEVGKRQVGKGTVQVTSRMVETPVEESVNLKEERAKITRRPTDRPVSPESLEAQQRGSSIEIEETAEQPVISKSARVVEEVDVSKETSETTQNVKDTVRHTELDVERKKNSSGKKPGSKR